MKYFIIRVKIWSYLIKMIPTFSKQEEWQFEIKMPPIKLFVPISYKPLFKIIILSYSIVYIYMWNLNLETTDFSLCLSFFIFKHNCNGRIEKKSTRKTNGSIERRMKNLSTLLAIKPSVGNFCERNHLLPHFSEPLPWDSKPLLSNLYHQAVAPPLFWSLLSLWSHFHLGSTPNPPSKHHKWSHHSWAGL